MLLKTSQVIREMNTFNTVCKLYTHIPPHISLMHEGILKFTSSLPAVAMSAWVKAAVYPLPSSISPMVLEAAISVCNPTSTITYTYPPHISLKTATRALVNMM